MFATLLALTLMRARAGNEPGTSAARERSMKRMHGIATAAAFSIVMGFGGTATAETLTGTISDAMCGKSHDTMTEHGKKMSEKQCTVACVEHGSQYVFVNGDTVLKVANQGFAALKQFAGDRVTLTGEVKGDTVTVAKIERAK
jgi:hypothetical protein